VLPSTDGATASSRTTIRIEAPRGLFIPKELERGGVAGYEPDTMAILLALAESSPAAIFDVGANVGPFALVAPALVDRPFVAFEPVPDVVEALRHMVAINDLACTIEEVAVGDANGNATLYLSAASDASNSLRPDFRVATGRIEVPLTTLDAYAGRTGVWPGLLKIDTETTEPAVLRGASEVLARRPWIVCEVLPGWTEPELESLLGPLGYRFFQISDEVPLTRRTAIAGDPTLRHANWLFAPTDPGPTLWASVIRWRAAIDVAAGPQAVAVRGR
jgi:FkbM family methyltransferase